MTETLSETEQLASSPDSSMPKEETVEDRLHSYQQAIDELDEAVTTDGKDRGEVPKGIERALLTVLLARDAVESDLVTPAPSEFARASDLDARFKSLANDALSHVPVDLLARWRATRFPPRDPPERAWWWYAPPAPTAEDSPLWVILQLTAGAIALALVLEVVRRLAQGSESVGGLVGVGIQALMGLGTVGSFTGAGRKLLQGVLARLGVRKPALSSWWRGLSLSFLGLAFVFFLSTSWMADVHKRLGFSSFNQGQLSEAVRYFERAAILNPGDASVRYALAFVYEASFRWSEAKQAYEETIRLDDSFYFAYNNLARLNLLRLDAPADALELMNRALEVWGRVNDSDTTNHPSKYLFSFELSERDAALESVIAPFSPVPGAIRQKFSEQRSSLSEAAEISRQRDSEWRISDESGDYAILREGGTLDVYDIRSRQLILNRLHKNRGWAYLELGYLELAERDLNTALGALPTPAPYCLLALVHKQRDQAEAELEAWGACLTVPEPKEGREVEALWRAEGAETILRTELGR